MKKTIIFLIISFAAVVFAQENDQQNNKQNNVQLMQPISVTIGGNFIVNGSFTASKFQRLDNLISTIYLQAEQRAIGSINKPEVTKQVKKELEKYPLRNIILKRISGEEIKIDLLKFRLTGDFSFNPYLQQDDLIIFPDYDLERSIVDITGAVNKPTQFQFVEGDKLSDAIFFAGGINPSYDDVKDAEISRLSNNGNTEETIKVSLTSDATLKRGDRITILFNENNRKVFKCLVLGEVNRPGYVYISKNNTTLKDLIKKAGGFTQNADLARAEILKGTDESQLFKMKSIREQYDRDSSFTTLQVLGKSLEELQTEEIKMIRSSDMTREEYDASFVYDNYLRFIEKKSVADFSKLNDESSEESKTVIRDGDLIIVPEKQNLVYVFGQVVNPGFVSFDSTKSWKYFIQKAGGYTENAKSESDVKLIKATNRAWMTAEENKIEPGDFLYVPKDIPRDFGYYIQQVGSISSIIATAVTLVYIIIQATK